MKQHFGFAFNDEDFSDRVLRVETISDDDEDESDSEAPDFVHKLKKVKTFHINSPILALNSPFFYKLFKNGMRESTQRDVTLKIHPSEEAALEDVLNFMYTNTLSTTSVTGLLNVLMVADRFEVTSCVTHCSDKLRNKPLSLESALLYLELPSSLLVGNVVEQLKDLAKQYLGQVFKDFTKSEEEAMALPLCALEVVFGINGLRVTTEDNLYDFMLRWARKHYPKLEERREILTNRLARFIYFPYLSITFLKDIQSNPEFDTEQVSNLVLESLAFNAGFPYGRQISATGFIQRAYEYHPIKVVHPKSDSNEPRCIVYLYLTVNEMENLFKSKQVFSQGFNLGGKWFFLVAQCNRASEQPLRDHFGLFLNMGQGSGTCTFDYEFSALTKGGFQSKFKFDDCTFLEGKGVVGKDNLFGAPWTDFVRVNGEYFVNEILHLRVELTLKTTQS